MLEVNGITTKYGPVTALLDVSMSVAPGEIVAIVGANGVGKTTLLRTIGGLLRPAEGSISLNGENLTRLDAHQRIKRGIVLVPEGRCLFHDLTVYENLLLGTFSWRRRATPASGPQRNSMRASRYFLSCRSGRPNSLERYPGDSSKWLRSGAG